jgi:hypothetical protein
MATVPSKHGRDQTLVRSSFSTHKPYNFPLYRNYKQQLFNFPIFHFPSFSLHPNGALSNGLIFICNIIFSSLIAYLWTCLFQSRETILNALGFERGIYYMGTSKCVLQLLHASLFVFILFYFIFLYYFIFICKWVLSDYF